MVNSAILLLLVSGLSIARGWYDMQYNVTSDICINSIRVLSNSYTPIRVYPVDNKTRDSFTAIKTGLKKQLSELMINTAKNYTPVLMYYHEFRRLDFAQFPIYCPQPIAYKVAELCNDAVSEATRLVESHMGNLTDKLPMHSPRGFLPCPLH